MCALFVGWRPRRAGRSRQHQTWKTAPQASAALQPLPKANKTDWLRPNLAVAAMTSPRFHPTTALAARIDFPWARESHGRSHPSQIARLQKWKQAPPGRGGGTNPYPTAPDRNQTRFQTGSLPADLVGPPDTPTRCKKCEKNQKIFRIYLPFLIKTCYKGAVV